MEFKKLKTTKVLKSKLKIRDIAEYTDYLEEVHTLFGNDLPWFRGQSNISYKLIPSITRSTSWKYSPDDEYELISDFIHKGRLLLPQIARITNHWEWMQLGQHYGLPTRLLDWTESALVALFFAIESEAESPCVWCLNPHMLNELSTNHRLIFFTDSLTREPLDEENILKYEMASKNLPDYPLAFLPNRFDRRMFNQKACFTAHGRKKCGFEELQKSSESPFLIRLDIEPNNIEYIRFQMRTLGISTVDIYPDLDGLSKDIKVFKNMMSQ
ncbi:FRG domain-containing protein [Litoribrevibacter albus]|uniref:FRG domain-containing protein n=1 Tax=Litoribrevibacter albus TaxID=1473156 RepID=A0AA37SFL7_9GAMM|nr:FRG domain-containing protein [Litoribrevibacter albus]GLQ33545.1 hypothetical protein GCM10007876_40250 [Litoribrevibacter albus]